MECRLVNRSLRSGGWQDSGRKTFRGPNPRPLPQRGRGELGEGNFEACRVVEQRESFTDCSLRSNLLDFQPNRPTGAVCERNRRHGMPFGERAIRRKARTRARKTTMAKRLEFFYDCSSPWTYLAFSRIEELAP